MTSFTEYFRRRRHAQAAAPAQTGDRGMPPRASAPKGPLQPGDLIVAHAPAEGWDNAAPGLRPTPCIVVWAHKDEAGQLQVTAIPGKRDQGSTLRPRDFALQNRAEQAHAGLATGYRFDMGEVRKFPWDARHAAAKTGPRPIGQLDRRAFQRASEAYGIAQRNERLRAETRAENARNNARRKTRRRDAEMEA